MIKPGSFLENIKHAFTGKLVDRDSAGNFIGRGFDTIKSPEKVLMAPSEILGVHAVGRQEGIALSKAAMGNYGIYASAANSIPWYGYASAFTLGGLVGYGLVSMYKKYRSKK